MLEGFYSILKRMKGVYRHCGENVCIATSLNSFSAINNA
jgi:hypothetical protein